MGWAAGCQILGRPRSGPTPLWAQARRIMPQGWVLAMGAWRKGDRDHATDPRGPGSVLGGAFHAGRLAQDHGLQPAFEGQDTFE